ncbi:MAG: nucleotidyltransferase domain-containing protein [Ruminococcus sp.]|nr:nucleotidyltransferase domain-containing protein [Ruminococcus sp.]
MIKNINAVDKPLNQDALNEMIAGISNIVGVQTKEIILYGSVARNESEPDSDVDIAIITDGKINKSIQEKLLDFAVDLDFKYDCFFSYVYIERQNFNKWVDDLPFYNNIAKEGISLWTAKTE